jgi:hypothetical protein
MVASLVANSGYQALRNGLAIKEYIKHADENGEPLQVHYWEVAIPVEACRARLAVFSHTILASHVSDPLAQQEIELLGRCIRNGEYSREQGVS